MKPYPTFQDVLIDGLRTDPEQAFVYRQVALEEFDQDGDLQHLRLAMQDVADAHGGAKGGTRIYFYFRTDGDQVIVNAEVKAGVSPSAALLREATAAAFADDQRN